VAVTARCWSVSSVTTHAEAVSRPSSWRRTKYCISPTWPVGISRQLLYAAGQRGLLHPGTGTAAGPQCIDAALGRLASASLLTFSVDDTTVAAHRLTMRVAVERQAQDRTLAGLGAGIAALLLAVTQSLTQPWQNRAAARDAIQQIMALHEHLAPYLGEQDGAVTEGLMQLRGWCRRRSAFRATTLHARRPVPRWLILPIFGLRVRLPCLNCGGGDR
jgi:hypothetical protein